MKRALAAAALFAASASAQPVPSADPGWTAYGMTTAPPCALWVEERGRGSPASELLEMWLLGFLSGYNRFAPESGGEIGQRRDSASLLAWIEDFCRAHPQSTVVNAAIRLIEEMEARPPR